MNSMKHCDSFKLKFIYKLLFMCVRGGNIQRFFLPIYPFCFLLKHVPWADFSFTNSLCFFQMSDICARLSPDFFFNLRWILGKTKKVKGGYNRLKMISRVRKLLFFLGILGTEKVSKVTDLLLRSIRHVTFAFGT